ncbi:TAXI family TRAP transporter solute-binding subunit [Salinisphaera sp. SPP-AMP-43]|uniref:TAXI family TRAP transporter solute-binding subunit n=1 Tax=Salinisphaera sp. SPP-AMP-43 TaxID=3121288 RepID=UPI003C6E24AB
MKYSTIWAAGALALAMTLAGCGQSGSDDQSQASSGSGGDQSAQPTNLIFGTGGTSGSYYPIGGALKGVFEKSDQIGNVQVVSTGASVQNINNIMDGTNQIAIVMSDVAYDAVHGNKQFEGRKAKIDALAGLYPNVVQIVALNGSKIDSVADLKGKRVGVGKVGSGVEASAKKVLEAAGLKYGDLSKVSHTGYADSVTDMSNGNLDAAFFTSGVPNSSITGLRQNTQVHFVNVTGETANTLLDKYPYYERYDIPAHKDNAYDLDSGVHTVSIRNLLIVPASMDKAVAQDLAQRFYDYLGSDSVSVAALKQFDRNKMNQNLVLPVHPGAKAFYQTLDQGASQGQSSDDKADAEAGDSDAS